MERDILQQFDNYLINLEYVSNSRRSIINSVKLFFKWLEIENLNYLVINYNDMIAFINYCREEKKNVNRTISLKLSAIKSFYNFLEEQEKVSDNPCEGVYLKGIMRTKPNGLLTQKELEEIYTSYPCNHITGKRNKVILSFIIFQGIGSGEISQLKIEDVNLEKGTVNIQPVKRGNARILSLDARQIIPLQQYITLVRPHILSLTNKDSEQLFISSGTGGKLTNTLSSFIKKIRENNPTITGINQIRTSVIRNWLSIYNIRQVQYMAGHRYVSSTDNYSIEKFSSLQQQIDLLHPLK